MMNLRNNILLFQCLGYISMCPSIIVRSNNNLTLRQRVQYWLAEFYSPWVAFSLHITAFIVEMAFAVEVFLLSSYDDTSTVMYSSALVMAVAIIGFLITTCYLFASKTQLKIFISRIHSINANIKSSLLPNLIYVTFVILTPIYYSIYPMREYYYGITGALRCLIIVSDNLLFHMPIYYSLFIYQIASIISFSYRTIRKGFINSNKGHHCSKYVILNNLEQLKSRLLLLRGFQRQFCNIFSIVIIFLLVQSLAFLTICVFLSTIDSHFLLTTIPEILKSAIVMLLLCLGPDAVVSEVRV